MNILSFFSETKNKNYTLITTSTASKFLFLLIELPVLLAFIFGQNSPIFVVHILTDIGLICYLLYMAAEFLGRHILYNNEKIIQRTYFFIKKEVEIKDILKYYFIFGVDAKEKRGAETLRIETKTEKMDINVFFYNKKILGTMIDSMNLK